MNLEQSHGLNIFGQKGCWLLKNNARVEKKIILLAHSYCFIGPFILMIYDSQCLTQLHDYLFLIKRSEIGESKLFAFSGGQCLYRFPS
jgi:hypothetical protein